jgi:F-type H+-transporting ATPase subunit epsilon
MLARLAPHTLRLFEDQSELDSSDGGTKYAAAEGWLEVFANKVTVLVTEAHEPGDLDSSELKSRLEDAEQRLSEAEDDSAAERAAEQDKARYEAFLEIAGS